MSECIIIIDNQILAALVSVLDFLKFIAGISFFSFYFSVLFGPTNCNVHDVACVLWLPRIEEYTGLHKRRKGNNYNVANNFAKYWSVFKIVSSTVRLGSRFVQKKSFLNAHFTLSVSFLAPFTLQWPVIRLFVLHCIIAHKFEEYTAELCAVHCHCMLLEFWTVLFLLFMNVYMLLFKFLVLGWLESVKIQLH